MRRPMFAIAAVVLFALAGCSKQKDTGFNSLPPAKSPSTAAVAGIQLAGGNQFQPGSFTAKVGDTVTWTDADNSGQPHNVVSDTDLFDSNPQCQKDPTKCMASGDTFTFKFTKAGTYPYYCVIHGGKGGVGMSGVVVVK